MPRNAVIVEMLNSANTVVASLDRETPHDRLCHACRTLFLTKGAVDSIAPDFKSQTVQGKGYDGETGTGRELG